MSVNTLIPLIKKSGSKLSPSAFQHIVNVVFHDIEAQHYDAIHSEMWESLQEQFDFLANDVLASGKEHGKNLRLLDIGSGTGLSTELLLNTKLGKIIGDIGLLDTSPNMLALAEKRIQKLNKNYTLYNSDVTDIDEKFDIIIVCSVLHHIPDLPAFLNHIAKIQNSGGILIHLQDPNGDFKDDPIYKNRVESYNNRVPKNGQDKTFKKLKNLLKSVVGGKKSYIDQVNDVLLEKKAISKRMSSEEIWSVTDIHVEDLPFSTGTGISLKFLKENLSDYSLIKARSYGFFGILKSKLIPEFQDLEEKAILNGEINGRNIAGTWIKN